MAKIKQVVKRTGAVVPFNKERIINAIYRATGVRCYDLPADKKWLKAQLKEQSQVIRGDV